MNIYSLNNAFELKSKSSIENKITLVVTYLMLLFFFILSNTSSIKIY